MTKTAIHKQGYKKSKLGWIPAEWEVVKLGDVTRFLDEKRKPIKESERAKMRGIYPYYGASGIIDYVNSFLFDDNLILLGEDGANIIMRSSPLVFQISGKVWVNNHAHVIKPKASMDIGYLTEFLESLNYEKYNTGTAQPKLNKKTCLTLDVLAPPLPEQQKIATILSTWDKAIEGTQKLIAAKEEQKKGLMQRLLIPTKESGQAPKARVKGFSGEWEEYQLGDLCKMYSGGTPSRQNRKYYQGDMPWIKSGELNQKIITVVEENISIEAFENSSAKFVEKGTILLALYGATAGVVAITEIKATINQAILAIVPSQQIYKKYLFFLLCKRMPKEVERLVQGGQPNLNGSMIKKLKIVLPTTQEQTAIAQILSTADGEITMLMSKLEALKKQKKGLMQRLLTGKIRVKID